MSTYQVGRHELIESSIRILLLISYLEQRKSLKITLDKLVLYDFFMKYPTSTLETPSVKDVDFDSYYSYFHIKPDRDKYRVFLRYLQAKGLITRTFSSNDFTYQTNDSGRTLVNNLCSAHSMTLRQVALYVRDTISKLSDTVVEELAIKRSTESRHSVLRGR